MNELGDAMLTDPGMMGRMVYGGSGTSDHDAVQFELVQSIEELTFNRTKIAGEKDGSTLEISTTGKGSVTLFDQYNDFLDFRKTEYLVIDDGATSNEVFELVTSDDSGGGMFEMARKGMGSNDWDNGIYVAHKGEAMTVDLGGTDYVFLGDDMANEVTVDIDQILSSGSGTVYVSGIEGDNLVVNGVGDSTAIVDAYNSVKTTEHGNADSATISWETKAGRLRSQSLLKLKTKTTCWWRPRCYISEPNRRYQAKFAKGEPNWLPFFRR